ncbi:MAG: chitobiase/beta-hexosaminidase C-terminal domain-containing protein [Treponema sp.]|nr:chitobiase/beta-hexosaminidase C-terminal domain-containing protein [Treponema sp.]
MKSILKKVAGVAVAVVLALGMIGCSNGSDDPVMPPVSGKQTVATPAFSVASGAVNSGTSVTISCATEGAKIYYTTDGNDPTAESTEYADAISITEAVTLKAIAVKSGMNSSAVASASYSIIPTKATCVPGDFVLKDGTMLPKDITLTDTQKSNVAAVIVRAATNGKPALGVGIVHNRSGLAWCIDSAAGCSTDITELQGDETTGYMDGSDGWEKLKAACSDAENNPEYYPAWNYSLTYAKTNSLEGDLATGWYLPTVAELYTIYQNKTTVDASLSKAGGSTFGESSYWSCCQSPFGSNTARKLGLDYGDRSFVTKYSDDDYVCAVRAFN